MTLAVDIVMHKWIGSVSEVPDVTIRFVECSISGEKRSKRRRNGVKKELLGLECGSEAKLHSKVLNSYSGYFKSWSERWKGESSVMSLELQSQVCYYADCFSRMYSLYAKNFDFGLKDFGDIKYSLELLKVASQIQFDDLIDSILLSLSTRFWSREDKDRIREYSSSEDFPRSRAEDLVGRLGMYESEEDRKKQSSDMLQHLVLTALDPKMHDEYNQFVLRKEAARRRSYQVFLESAVRLNANPNTTPSNLGRTVIMMLTREARIMLDRLNQDCDQNNPLLEDYTSGSSLRNRILAVCYVLKTLLASKVADVELVKSFVHSDAMISKSCEFIRTEGGFDTALKELTETVLLVFQEMVDGRLPFKSSERKAVLVKWHPLLMLQIEHGTDSTHLGKLKQVRAKLFSTLSFQDKTEILKAVGEYCCDDIISVHDLELMQNLAAM